MNFKLKKSLKSGQVLLITIMLLATALTIVLAVSFRSTTETQTAKLEEESQKALAGAEAGIEEALRTGNTSIDISGLNVGPGFTGTATTDTTASPTFITPVLQRDEQYTLYLDKYTPGSGFSTTAGDFFPTTGNLVFYFGDTTRNDCAYRKTTALELTFIDKDYNAMTRKLIDPCTTGKTVGTSDLSTNTPAPTDPLANQNFLYKTAPLQIPSLSKVVLIRVLFSQTRIGVDAGVNNLPLQGKTVTSEAKSPTGVTKRVQLFQSLPQIPADFFVTSF